MKAVILAGGFGTRLSEETILRPKPMIEIGGKPILWHILKMYSAHGINEFIICLGYKGYVIKEYFANYFLHESDVTFDLSNNQTTVHNKFAEPWKITLINTGEQTLTGGRLKRISEFLNAEEPFCFTYGDGLSDINIRETIEFHKKHGKVATVTAVQPPGRYGSIKVDQGKVLQFTEKPIGDDAWINGGFFVLNKAVMNYIDGDQSSWEGEPLIKLAAAGQMMAFQHSGFWQAMDTLREKNQLEELWKNGKAPWKVW